MLSSGLAGYVLTDGPGDQANQIANMKVQGNDRNREIIETAKLLRMRKQLDFAGDTPADIVLAKKLTSRCLPVTNLSNLRPAYGRFCTGQYNFPEEGQSLVRNSVICVLTSAKDRRESLLSGTTSPNSNLSKTGRLLVKELPSCPTFVDSFPMRPDSTLCTTMPSSRTRTEKHSGFLSTSYRIGLFEATSDIERGSIWTSEDCPPESETEVQHSPRTSDLIVLIHASQLVP